MMNLRKAAKIVEDVSIVLRNEDSANSRICAEALDRVVMFLSSYGAYLPDRFNPRKYEDYHKYPGRKLSDEDDDFIQQLKEM